jgi:hypothetical protein
VSSAGGYKYPHAVSSVLENYIYRFVVVHDPRHHHLVRQIDCYRDFLVIGIENRSIRDVDGGSGVCSDRCGCCCRGDDGSVIFLWECWRRGLSVAGGRVLEVEEVVEEEAVVVEAVVVIVLDLPVLVPRYPPSSSHSPKQTSSQ